MSKKLSLLLLLLLSSCNYSQVDRSVQSQPLASIPTLTPVLQAETVEIHNDWNGYSDITPILRHYKLRLEQQKLVGNAYIAVGGYGAGGIRQQQTTKVKIPAAVTAKFLDTLSKTPLQVGTYKPRMERTDDYPAIEIKVRIASVPQAQIPTSKTAPAAPAATLDPRQQVVFSSQSQGVDRTPWKISIRRDNARMEYISNSPLPAQAFQLLSPYLDRSGVDRIIGRRRQKHKPAAATSIVSPHP